MSKPPPPPLFVLRGHTDYVTALCFLPANNFIEICRDRPSLASGSRNGEIFLWDLEINRIKFRLSGHDGKAVLWLGYYEDAILTQAKNDFINIWNYSNDTWVITCKFPSPEIGFCAASFLTTEQNLFLAITGEEKSVNIISYNTRSCVSEITQSTQGMCMCIKLFIWKSKMCLLCGYENGSLSLWDCESNKEISSLTCHKEPLFCLDFDSNYRCCGISGSAEDTLEEWSIKENSLIKGRRIKLTNPGVNAVVIRTDGKILLTAGWDSAIRVFSWKTLKPLAILKFHVNSILCLCFAPGPINKKESVFASGSKDNNISLWSIY